MSTKSEFDFTDDEVEVISKNKYVKNVNKKRIVYADEFKKIFVKEYDEGKAPIDIFTDNGFNPAILGCRRIGKCSYRWRKKVREGKDVSDSRENNSGRTRKTVENTSLEERYTKLRLENEYLKMENKYLKEVRKKIR